MNVPNSAINLSKAIRRCCAPGQDDIRLARAMADIVIGQMLPQSVVKGGSSLMFRYGGGLTRYTKDIDTARIGDLESFLESFRQKLVDGWCGFTGRITDVIPPSPPNVPKSYVMIPFDVKLQYLGRPWMTVRIEIGHNEIGDAEDCELELPEDIAAVFMALGFPKPDKIPVMKLSYQVAQKLHAVSGNGSDRAHDLIDLQLMNLHSSLDLVDIRKKCERLFPYRREQSWPVKIVKGDRWDEVYDAALKTVDDDSMLLKSAKEAVEWANDLISKIMDA